MDRLGWLILTSTAVSFIFINPVQVKRFSEKAECNSKRQDEIDYYSLKLNVFGKNGRLYPTNANEIKIFCNDSYHMINEMEKFSKSCYDSFINNHFKIFVYNTKRALKLYCGKKKTRRMQQLISFTPCINPYVPQDQCTEQLGAKIRNLIPYNMNSEKISYMCCYFADLINCFDKSLSKLQCMTDEARELFLEYIRFVNGDIINFACGEYTEQTDRCDHLKPLNKFKVNPKIKMDMRHKSLFFITIAMLQSLGNHTDLLLT